MRVDSLWQNLESRREVGGAIRLSAEYPHDAFCGLDPTGRRQLLFILKAKPPKLPRFQTVEVLVGKRHDGKWSLAIELRDRTLAPMFSLLCDDIIAAVADTDPTDLGQSILSRLVHWRKLLEAGTSELLGTAELRGLVAELLMMRQFLGEAEAGTVVEAWVGPLDAPQDFVLPHMLMEVKAVMPSSSAVRINSIDQLDVRGDVAMKLAVLSLSPSTADEQESFSAAALVADIRRSIESDTRAAKEFELRLLAAGYADHDFYSETFLRLNGIRLYAVQPDFPRLTRSTTPVGITDVRYDLELQACSPFEERSETTDGN